MFVIVHESECPCLPYKCYIRMHSSIILQMLYPTLIGFKLIVIGLVLFLKKLTTNIRLDRPHTVVELGVNLWRCRFFF
jgi:hypothetical protein